MKIIFLKFMLFFYIGLSVSLAGETYSTNVACLKTQLPSILQKADCITYKEDLLQKMESLNKSINLNIDLIQKLEQEYKDRSKKLNQEILSTRENTVEIERLQLLQEVINTKIDYLISQERLRNVYIKVHRMPRLSPNGLREFENIQEIYDALSSASYITVWQEGLSSIFADECAVVFPLRIESKKQIKLISHMFQNTSFNIDEARTKSLRNGLITLKNKKIIIEVGDVAFVEVLSRGYLSCANNTVYKTTDKLNEDDFLDKLVFLIKKTEAEEKGSVP